MTDETTRRAGRAELDRLNAAPKKAAAAGPAKKKPRHAAQSLGDVLGIGKKKQSTHDGKTVDDYVKEAIDGAPNP